MSTPHEAGTAYVSACRAHGLSDEVIANALREQGWTDVAIQGLLAEEGTVTDGKSRSSCALPGKVKWLARIYIAQSAFLLLVQFPSVLTIAVPNPLYYAR